MLCADLVQLQWRDPAGRVHSIGANMEDISLKGLCLQTEDALPMGVAVTIRHEKAEFRGTVRYCIYRDVGYFLGIEFAPGTKWTPRRFRPMHLLDPRRLVQRAVSRAGRAALS